MDNLLKCSRILYNKDLCDIMDEYRYLKNKWDEDRYKPTIVYESGDKYLKRYKHLRYCFIKSKIYKIVYNDGRTDMNSLSEEKLLAISKIVYFSLLYLLDKELYLVDLVDGIDEDKYAKMDIGWLKRNRDRIVGSINKFYDGLKGSGTMLTQRTKFRIVYNIIVKDLENEDLVNKVFKVE